ncbi:hypothetical protein [Selenomonas sputigena]|uniref:hypothetical protein n=1 Tax=Selenomonas sputigena TaxID=69823 RepID=UPI00223095BF|nr:hypothetical protein [Selenomonas sputigena]UZD42791.1 hypothetical protein OL240_09610 [Selenomonas sputigena]
MNLKATHEAVAQFEQRIRELLAEGVSVAEAVRRAYALYPVMKVMADEAQAQIIAEAVRGYGGALPDGVSDRLFTHSWAPDKLTLSERTTRGGLLVQALVAQAIKKQLRKSTTYRQTALTIFDGYQKGGLIPTQDLPKFLQELVTAGRRADIPRAELLRMLKPVKKEIAKRTTAGMRAAYAQLAQAVETQNEKALENAIYVATQERTRYFAERIARTEMARAYHDGFLARWDADENCIAYQWRLSGRHPVYDICDLYAKANLYGLGAGIFPKGKVPLIPAHPNCMCVLKPVIRGMLDNETPHERIEEGGMEYLRSVNPHQRRLLLGVHGARAVMEGKVSWTELARGYGGRKFVGRFHVDSKGRMVYNKIIESDGRKASVLVRSDGSIVLTEKHDLNEPYSPSMRGKPNGVVLYGSPGESKTRQTNIAIFDENGKGFIMLHYGPHANPKHHPFGKLVDGRRTGCHTHTVTYDGGRPDHSRPREMSEEEEKYLRR